MSLIGMDTDALYDQANRLLKIAHDLRTAQAELNAASGALVTIWDGDGAKTHRTELLAEAGRLGGTAKAIESAARSIHQAADRQRMISSW
ncbi:hypothetical protein DBR22_00235 [Arthrobacter sp. HMWF013]|nr:hypothetical protein DBR22_00235 [Arthrobacter sp. HMWF013]